MSTNTDTETNIDTDTDAAGAGTRPVYAVDGTADGETALPPVFATQYRPDLIAKAVRVAQANRKQPYGADEYAGLRTPAESPGSGRGMAHVPRQDGRARRVPQAVKGRRAHPPKAEKDRGEGMNTKTRKLAVRSALAATADATLVGERGHAVGDVPTPVIVEDAFADLVKTREVVAFLESVGVHADIERADEGTSVRAGRGTTRGRKYKRPKSILFVTVDEPSRAARNLAGADVATAANVGAEDLAPGGHPGRLTVFTEAALTEVNDR